MKRILAFSFSPVLILLAIILCSVQLAPAKLDQVSSSAPDASQESGETLVVTNSADSGPGTLRQALLDAQNGDTITFDPAVFPPTAPITIALVSTLPEINQGNLTIDASDAGVILDGGNVSGAWVPGLPIMSDGNTIQGLHVTGFSGSGIALNPGVKHNTIGGERSIGNGPFGQGNLTTCNDVGIGLWGDGTAFNSIQGNLVGTDATGADGLGNQTHGIMILENASANIIGPDNIIAHNGGDGISIGHSGAVRNTITRNSIHDNGGMGIALDDTSNTGLAAPLIFDFDLSAGTVAGTTCPSCTVEIFSDASDEGAMYEGQTVADGLGVFSLDKGTVLTGPSLTATTSDQEGNTSQFSAPTTGARRSSIIQEGNKLPKTILQIRASMELQDNRIGAGWGGLWQPSDYQAIIDTEILGAGLKHVDFTINTQDWPMVVWDKPELSIDPSHDALYTRMAANGVTISYNLMFWDKAYVAGGGELSIPRFQTEEEIQRYLEFVQFIVNHFKDRVKYFEIWNEPNIGDSIQWIEVEKYIELVKRVVPIIQQEYPEAKIVVGATTNLRESESQDYLFGILNSEIMPLVDAVSLHPMSGTSPQYEYYAQYYHQYPALVQEIKDVASANGFSGEYVAEELTWRTESDADPAEPWTYSQTAAAKYYTRGILMNLGMDLTVGVGMWGSGKEPAFSTVRNLCTVMAGAEPANLPIQIQSTATNTVSYAFSLSNGDHLIALWNDGVAVDYDPGISSTLRLDGFADHTVTGIDVLHGFQQQMITSEEDGNLVIRDLLIKDYPIIFRVTPKKHNFLPIVMKGRAR